MLTSVISKLIHSLCLENYPCGRGSWHKTSLRECEDLDDATSEEEDALLELLRSPLSPWKEEVSWSPQALALREVAVKTPEILKGNFICSFFTILHIVDKGVSKIDEGLLMFSCLEELVLSANNITELPSSNLPMTLRVLELYANQIKSLKSVNTHPPPRLQHLGLGNNCLGSPEDIQYFTADLWPQLRSLDLSWSGFTEQCALIEALFALPCLQSLVLEGNPLTLTPSYPGFVLDSLFRLLYMDGKRVTPEDRLRFSGLAKLKGPVCEEAEVIVCIQKMKGVPSPALPLDEFPVISHSYSVSYEFLNQPQFQENTDVGGTSTNIPQNLQEQHEEDESISHTPADPLRTSRKDQNKDSNNPVVMNSTLKQEWAEVIEFNYTTTHRISDLPALKNFFLRGLWLTVEEEKVLSWPAPPAVNAETKTSADKKGKESTDTAQKLKDKKKKKEPVLNLIQEAPVRRTLSTVHVELKDLLEGKDKIQMECDLGVLLSDQNVRTTVTREKELSKKPKEDKKEDKKIKPSGDIISSQRNITSSKGKGKGRKESETDAPADESSPSNMEPLTVELSVQLSKVLSVLS
ncbi:leucine-rich repeat-containing protein 43 isoform X2 [Pygocentrus nattereri]|uniref:leucine-rich repeat-containing protein 43 isoform X2 n=1 Tax=Pygocentrus nattereri TaxID=42514 RepID=UPI000814664E|nr:leucine-rich repeat-containing protein 43 isoform X2 [Pygocentrus nattereri]XP_017579135.1 leucine-rich repeat-containing protein 43 isoform X2 [Pygocentrus nattereri]